MDVSDAPFYLIAIIRPRLERKDEAESATTTARWA